jgi:hypothetical protein
MNDHFITDQTKIMILVKNLIWEITKTFGTCEQLGQGLLTKKVTNLETHIKYTIEKFERRPNQTLNKEIVQEILGLFAHSINLLGLAPIVLNQNSTEYKL